MTRIQLSTGFIDLPINTDFPIDLSFADITQNGARSGGFSRALDIDGTEENTVLLGSYFDIDLKNEKFNRNVKTECSLIQNGVEVFEGFIQLIEIIRVNKLTQTNSKAIKYKISIFDEVGNFFNELGEKELTDLSMPSFGHTFNRSNVISSWLKTSEYIYPQFAKPDNKYTLRDFKPAYFEWEYFTRIFSQNGYTFTFNEADQDHIRMNKRFIPYNGKQTDEIVSKALQESYSVNGEMSLGNYDTIGLPSFPTGRLPFIDSTTGALFNLWNTASGAKIQLDSIIQDSQNQYLTATDEIENKAGQGRTFNLQTTYNYSINVRGLTSGSPVAWEVDFSQAGVSRCDVILTLIAQSTTNVQKVAVIDSGQIATTFNNGGTYNFASGFVSLASGTNSSISNLGVFDQNEKFDIHAIVVARYYLSAGNVTNNPNNIPCTFIDTNLSSLVDLEFEININNLDFKSTPNINELVKGSNVDVSLFVPKKIKQKDLISSISKSYNLLFVPDISNEKNIIIKTRDKYYEDGLEWDWTNKFSEDQDNTINFLSNEVSKKHVLKYSDDKDEINTFYQNESLETYGQTNINLDNEYTVGEVSRQLIFAPTPSIYAGIGVPLPSINGINPDNKIRVLLTNGKKTVSPYEFYDDQLINSNELAMIGEYLSSSMFDNDYTPNFSILFDAPKYLFHNFQTGQTSNYLYNLHFQNELTNLNEGKKLNAYFYLSEYDFQKLSKKLDWKIFIKDNGWFFISKVYGYNTGKKTITKVDLITADDKTNLKYKKPFIPISGPGVSNDAVNGFNQTVNNATNLIIGTSNTISGNYNLIVGQEIYVFGSQNKVLSSKVQIQGDNNEVPTGVPSTKIMGDNTIITESGTFIDGNKANPILNKTLTTPIVSAITTPVKILEWEFNAVAGKSYLVKIVGTHQAGVASTGISLGIGGSARCTVSGVIRGSVDSTAVDTELAITANSMTTTLTTTGVSPINTNHYNSLDIVFMCNLSGDVFFTFASSRAARTAIYNAGSTIIVKEL